MTNTATPSNLSIGYLTKRFGVSAESIRNWERNGDIPPATRTPGGHRRYNHSHVKALEAMFSPQKPEDAED